MDEKEWERLKKLECQGKITLGSGKIPEEFWDMPKPEDPEGQVRKAIREDRDRSW